MDMGREKAGHRRQHYEFSNNDILYQHHVNMHSIDTCYRIY